MINHELTLQETVGDPQTIQDAAQYDVHLNLRNSRLVNLEGLADNSLLLSLEIRPEACNLRGHGLRLETKVWSFRPAYSDSKLHDEFYMCDWPSMLLQLRLPESRVRGWKTVAMILLTFGRVTRESWLGIVNMQDPPDVSGLNWRQIEQRIRSEMKKNKLIKESVFDKEDANMYL